MDDEQPTESGQQKTPFVRERHADPCVMVLFGATGDLAKRKLLPGLYNLYADKLLPDGFAVVGVGRSVGSLEEFRKLQRETVEKFSRTKLDPATWAEFEKKIDYVRGDVDDASTYAALRDATAAADKTHGTKKNRLYCMAVPPSSFSTILGHLRDAGLLYHVEPETPAQNQNPWSRIMIEKPFGRDLESAKALNKMAASFLDESQIYRIDHYLGKETVQNILVFRFGNSIFEPIWNRKYIDHVQITAAEELGMEGRGKFYDETGALRDVVQNHLLETMALVTMEPPVSFKADDQRDERVQVLRSIRHVKGEDVAATSVRAQYRGYHDEPNIAKDSRTPTYAALKVRIDNWRWQGVPFYLRAGKKMKSRLTEVAIHFQRVPLSLFGRDEHCQRLDSNVLTLRLQPNEGISLRFATKSPGDDLVVTGADMNFTYAEAFKKKPQEAYERLFLDCMRGDPALFARRDDVERAWEFVNPILEEWDARKDEPMPTYEPGSDGPDEADKLIQRDGRQWRKL